MVRLATSHRLRQPLITLMVRTHFPMLWRLSSALSAEALNALRRIETISNPDGSATSHVVVRCTLADIARATNLRVEDAAFALNECGLLTHVQVDSEGTSEHIGITREMVEAVAKERRVKEMCMSLAHVLL